MIILNRFIFVKDNFSYTEDGRPMTAIPFNEKMNQLGNNFPLAKGRLYATIQRLEKAGIRAEFQEKIEEGLRKDRGFTKVEYRTQPDRPQKILHLGGE